MANQYDLTLLLAGVNAWNEARKERRFWSPDLSKADLRDEFRLAGKLDEFRRIPLKQADLSDTNLADADLRRADLRGAILSKNSSTYITRLERANLSDAEMSGANLAYANLSNANCRGTSLRDADLTEANLYETDLQRADLRGAKLSGTKFTRADVTNADVRTLYFSGQPEPTKLSNIDYLAQEQLSVMIGDSDTLISKRLSYPAHWPKKSQEIVEIPIAVFEEVHANIRSNFVLIEMQRDFLKRLLEVNLNTVGVADAHDARVSLEVKDMLERLDPVWPTSEQQIDETVDQQAVGYISDLWANLIRVSREYVSAKNIVEAGGPVALILGLSSLGALIGGPVGGVAGASVAQVLTKQKKPGDVAEKLQKGVS
jgi:hypothetical protein